MEAMWFYAEGPERRGPVPVEELVQVLLAVPDGRRVLVWREGLPGWQPAGSVPEISARLPHPGPAANVSSGQPVVVADAEAIARLYRRLVLLVGFQILVSFFQLPSQVASREASTLVLLVSLILLCLLVALAVTAYQLTQRLGEGLPVLWAIVMFLPCFNIIGLLVLSSKAQAWCRRHGIKVGLLGPTKESIEELRRRSDQGSTFD